MASASEASGSQEHTIMMAKAGGADKMAVDVLGNEQASIQDSLPAEKQSQDSVPYFSLLSTADRLDYLLMVVGTFGACGHGVAWPMFALVFASFADAFGNPGADFMAIISIIALNFVYIAIGSAAGAWMQSACWTWTGNRQTARLRLCYLHAALRQDISYFDTQTTMGGVLQGLNEDSSLVQAAISEKAAHFIQHMTTFFAGIIVAFTGGWDMTLVMVGSLPLLAGVGVVLSKVTTTMSTRSAAAYTEASSVAAQALAQIRTVASYTGEERAWTEYSQALEGPTKAGVWQALYTGIALGGINAVVYFTYAYAFYYGAWRVSTGNYTGGQVLQVFTAALLGGFSLGQAAPVLEIFSKGQTAGARLLKVIDRIPAIDPDNTKGAELPQVEGRLQMVDLIFAYPVRPDVRVFNNFSLIVPAGQTVALVGSSGSGKSTAVQLIERFYDPSSGVIMLDGIDLRSLNVKWLRSQVGLVSQEPTLFATSIGENIAMGRRGATQQEIEEAARSANAHTFICSLPEKYNTGVGERGIQLSGGQKQRIAIARAILKNPKILLLDEATSALDTQSERLVQSALDNMIIGRTTVVVAHRLSTIKGADKIAVVSAGQVIEEGSHAELIKNHMGAYSTLVKLQMQEEAEKATVEVDSLPDEGVLEDVEETQEKGFVAVAVELAPMSTKGSMFSNKGLVSGDVRTSLGMRRGSGEKRSIELGTRTSNTMAGQTSLGKGGEALPPPLKLVEPPVHVPLSRILMMNRPELSWGIMGFIAAGVSGCVQPAFAFIISSFVIVFYGDKDGILGRASFWSWMFCAIAFGVLIASTLQHLSFGKMGQELARRIRIQLFRRFLYNEIGWFDRDENSSGMLTSKLATDAAYVRGAVADTMGLIIQNAICLAAGYGIAFAYSWRMALVITGALPFVIGGSFIYYQNIVQSTSGQSGMYASANSAVSDALTSIRVVHAYNLHSQVTSLYEKLTNEVVGNAGKQAIKMGGLLAYSEFSLFAIYGLIIWFGGREVESGRTDFDGMLKAFLAILLAAMGIAQAQIGFPDIGKAKGAVQSIFPMLDRPTLIDASSTEGRKAKSGGLAGEISLQNVTFAYPSRPSVMVFRNFTLDVPAGKTVALVGESGSGKSTIVGLVQRYYDVLTGTVMVDGVDVRDFNLKWLRSNIGLVSQEPALFTMSVLENIRYSRPEASMDEVEAAARVANAHDFIAVLPEGYNTKLGERGVQLSGGQKQRVAIARAILKDPRILLLDEATSALDAHSEKVVQEALDRIMVGRTSVVVAHRLTTIRNADKIVLVYRGSVLEQGTHAELMALPDGGYGRLVAAQNGPAVRAHQAVA